MATLTFQTSLCSNLVMLPPSEFPWAPLKGLSRPLPRAHCNRETLPGFGDKDRAVSVTGDLVSHVENKDSIEIWSLPIGVLRADEVP